MGDEKNTITTKNLITLHLHDSWAATRYCLKRNAARERTVIEGLKRRGLLATDYGDKLLVRTYELASLDGQSGVDKFMSFLESQNIQYRIT